MADQQYNQVTFSHFNSLSQGQPNIPDEKTELSAIEQYELKIKRPMSDINQNKLSPSNYSDQKQTCINNTVNNNESIFTNCNVLPISFSNPDPQLLLITKDKDDHQITSSSINFEDGSSYKGGLQNGKRHGYGVQSWPFGQSYKGEWYNNKPHGVGQFIFRDFSGLIIQYKGMFQNGQKHGNGVLILNENSRYEGEFEVNQLSGFGTYYYSDGKIYAGQWKQNKMSGKGKLTYPDGSFYDGEFKNGVKHGKGLFAQADGRIYDGEWVEGTQHGQGIITINKIQFKGIWRNGKRIRWI